MKNFSYKAPDSLNQAKKMLTTAGSHIIAGGMTLIPDMKAGNSTPQQVVDLAKIESLKGIKKINDRILIGAMTSYAEVAENSLIIERFDALAKLSAEIGDPAVRVKATVGGALAVNDPSSDYPAAIMALDGVIITDKREIPAEQFFVSQHQTLLEKDEIITAVSLAVPVSTAYCSLRAKALRLPICGVFIATLASGTRVAVTGLSSQGVFRWPELEKMLTKGNKLSFTESPAFSAVTEYIDTIHGSASYRRHLAGVLVKRAAEELKP